jgi:hypothetical protein
VFDVQNQLDSEGRKVLVWDEAKDRLGQEWDVVYADEYPEEPKKGELNEDFGLYVERPFYIVSG